MKAKELTTKSQEELKKMLAETRAELDRLLFIRTTKPIPNIREIRNKKKDVARILTVLATKKDVNNGENHGK